MVSGRVAIGIDLGLNGAVAVMRQDRLEVYDTPTVQVRRGGKMRPAYDEESMVRLLDRVAADDSLIHKGSRLELVAILEDVHALPNPCPRCSPEKRRFGGVQGAHSMGLSSGLWRGILSTLEVPYRLVQPAVWKKVYGLWGQEKPASILAAKRHVPHSAPMLGRAKDHNRAEAILLAHYLLVRDGGA